MHLTVYFVSIVFLCLGLTCEACPSSEWITNNNRCFLFRVEEKHHKSWQDALKTCRSESNGEGTLVTILDNEENSWLLETAKSKMGKETHIWIGMSKVTTGYPHIWEDLSPVFYIKFEDGVPNDIDGKWGYPYIWEDLSPVLYINFEDGEPNDIDGTQNCVRMWGHNGQWDDFDCNAPGETKHGYICQDHYAPQGPGGGLVPQSAGYQGCCSTGDVFAILFGIIIAIEIIAAVFGYLYVFKWGKQLPWQSQADGVQSFDNPVAQT